MIAALVLRARLLVSQPYALPRSNLCAPLCGFRRIPCEIQQPSAAALIGFGSRNRTISSPRLVQGEIRNSQAFAVSHGGLVREDACASYVGGEDRIGERVSILHKSRHEFMDEMRMRPTVALEPIFYSPLYSANRFSLRWITKNPDILCCPTITNLLQAFLDNRRKAV